MELTCWPHRTDLMALEPRPPLSSCKSWQSLQKNHTLGPTSFPAPWLEVSPGMLLPPYPHAAQSPFLGFPPASAEGQQEIQREGKTSHNLPAHHSAHWCRLPQDTPGHPARTHRGRELQHPSSTASASWRACKAPSPCVGQMGFSGNPGISPSANEGNSSPPPLPIPARLASLKAPQVLLDLLGPADKQSTLTAQCSANPAGPCSLDAEDPAPPHPSPLYLPQC